MKIGEYVQRTNTTNICYGKSCIAIRKGCQTPDVMSCPELNVAVLPVARRFTLELLLLGSFAAGIRTPMID